MTDTTEFDAPTPFDPNDPEEAEFLGIPYAPTTENDVPTTPIVDRRLHENLAPMILASKPLPYAENHAPRGLHPCVGCGLELDGDDPNDRCDECVTPTGSGRAS